MWQESVCSTQNTDNQKTSHTGGFLFWNNLEIHLPRVIIVFSLCRNEVDSHEKESSPHSTHSIGFGECFLAGISL